jgi:hypothetical protein
MVVAHPELGIVIDINTEGLLKFLDIYVLHTNMYTHRRKLILHK